MKVLVKPLLLSGLESMILIVPSSSPVAMRGFVLHVATENGKATGFWEKELLTSEGEL